MPAKQRIYKVDVTELADMIALATVTDENETVKVITDFCDFMAIPLDSDLIKEKTTVYQTVADKIGKKAKK